MKTIKRKANEPLTDEQKEFAGENWPLFLSFYARTRLKFCGDGKDRFNDSFYDLILLAYFRSVRNWDSTKSTFGTFAYHCMFKEAFRFRNDFVSRLQRKSGERNVNEAEEYVAETSEDVAYYNYIEESLDYLLTPNEHLTEKMVRAIKLKYLYRHTLDEIASIMFDENFFSTPSPPCKERIRQIIKQGLEVAQRLHRKKSLSDYI